MLRFIVVPASIVNVTPLFIVSCPLRIYGLLASVQVVSAFIIPSTYVDACALPKFAELTIANPHTRTTSKNVDGIVLIIDISLINNMVCFA